MKHLKVWQKLAVMGLVFIAPFAVVTVQLVSSVEAQGVDAARREVTGLAYSESVLKLGMALHLHRDIASAALGGLASFQGRLAGARADVMTAVKELDEVDLTLGPELHMTERWTAVRAGIVDLLEKTPTLSPEQSFARHTASGAELSAVVGEVGHISELTLDSDLERRRLIDVVTVLGPELSASLSRARGVGAPVAAGTRSSPEEIENLRREAILVQFLHAKMDESIGQTLESNPTFKSSLDAPAQAASAAVLETVAAMTTRASGDAVSQAAEEYFSTLSRGIETIGALNARTVAALTVSLEAQMVQMRRQVMQTLAWAALGLLVVSLIGFAILRDITVPLARAIDVANRIATGDLSTSIDVRGRRDEIGLLAHAFDRMVVALKETVTIAERIAAGDLGVVITPRSDRDVMNHALAHMVERLSALVGDVQQSGIQVKASVNQIAATARQQEATAAEVAATTTEIGATSRQIAATSLELVRTMSEVSELAEDSARLAGKGQNGVAGMDATMRHVIDAAGAVNAKLSVLSEKAGAITQVITTIAKVADQTNLLSLNAAIEAEKAGEYGRGFSVVATEIRRLADQTAVATYDIEQMVRDMQSAVTAGVMGMDKFSEQVRRGMSEVQQVAGQLSEIIQQVQELSPRARAVNEGMQAQATGAEQIMTAIVQLGDGVRQTLEALRESNQVIDGLNRAATGMHTGVSRFKMAA
jgi:methyl-accepting chemotaxis protein